MDNWTKYVCESCRKTNEQNKILLGELEKAWADRIETNDEYNRLVKVLQDATRSELKEHGEIINPVIKAEVDLRFMMHLANKI